MKVMHVVLSGTRTLSFCFLFPADPTVNAQYKLVIQDKLRPYIWKTCSGPLGKSVILHHDNASVHTVKAMTGFFQTFNWEYWTTIGILLKNERTFLWRTFESEEEIVWAAKYILNSWKKMPMVCLPICCISGRNALTKAVNSLNS